MANIFVTGANGYIGKHVVESLLNEGQTVFAVDFKNTGIDKRASFIQASIFEDVEMIDDILEKTDVCLHMAWRDGFVHNADSHIQDLWKHYSFLCHVMEKGVGQIAVMGTMHEIGYWEGAVDENTPTNPVSKYGIAKNALRQLIMQEVIRSNVTLQWLRCYYITGDDMHNNSVFSKILQAEKENISKFPFTSGKNLYDFIDVNILGDQIAKAVTQTKVTGIINCCTGQPVSLADKVEQFIEEKNLKIRLDYGKYPDRPYDSPGIWGDSTKIETIING